MSIHAFLMAQILKDSKITGISLVQISIEEELKASKLNTAEGAIQKHVGLFP